MSFPNFDPPSPMSSQDKALMDIAAAMKTLAPFQLHQLNIVRLNLKVIFLSDIVYEAYSVIKTCYVSVNTDVTTSSSYTCTVTSPSRKANKM